MIEAQSRDLRKRTIITIYPTIRRAPHRHQDQHVSAVFDATKMHGVRNITGRIERHGWLVHCFTHDMRRNSVAPLCLLSQTYHANAVELEARGPFQLSDASSEDDCGTRTRERAAIDL